MRLPLFPVIVSVDVPAGVLLLVITVIVAVPLPVIVGGEKLAEAPEADNPPALKVTVPAKPLTAPKVTA